MKDVSVGRVVGFGLISAVPGVAAVWLATGSALWGLAIGLAFGACIAILTRRLWSSPAFAGLSFDQRRRVVRTLRRGEPMRDPELAPAVVEHGKRMLDKQFRPKALRIGYAVIFLLGAAAATVSIAVDGWREWASWPSWYRWPSGTMLMVLSLVMLFVAVPSAVRERRRMAHSVAETEKLQGMRAP